MKKKLTIEQLRAEWKDFHDLDRAEAVRSIHDSGPSIREIGRQLHVSDSGLCRLLVALDAPVEDKLLARKGEITTSELVRRSKAAGRARAARNREEIKLERERQTFHAADLICRWLLETQMFGPDRARVVEDTQFKIRGDVAAELLPSNRITPGASVEQIIEQTKPPALKKDDNIDITGWFSEWLYNWTFYAFREEANRYNALDLALERQRAG